MPAADTKSPWLKNVRRLLAGAGQKGFQSLAWLLACLRGSRPDEPAYLSWTARAWADYLHTRDRYGALAPELLHCPDAIPGLVSIVLPVHNGARFLAEAIDSIVQQTCAHWELIIVDDGSMDDSATIAEAYAARDLRIRLIRQENRKLPAALNAGFAQARGEFLTWTSDDNRLRPPCLERLLNAMQAQPGADMLYADYQLIDEVGQPLHNADWCAELQSPPGSGAVHLWRDVSALNLINGNFVGPAFLFRARAWRLIGGFSPHWFTCEDYDYALRLNAELQLCHLGSNECLYEYRLHDAALSAVAGGAARHALSERLMVFDDFRRGLVRWPCWWFLSHDDVPASRQLAESLQRELQQAGQQVHLQSPPKTAEPPCPFGDANPLRPLLRIHCGTVAPSGWPDHAPGFVLRTAPNGSRLQLHAGEEPWLESTMLTALRQAMAIWQRQHFAREVEDLIATANDHSAIASNGAPWLSVIVCTRRATAQVAPVLAALAGQFAASEAELILIDNRRSGDPMDFDRAWREVSGRPPVRVVRAIRSGLAYARNLGLGAAHGTWVVYLDDDTLPAADWLIEIKTAIAAHPECAVIGGAIAVRDPEPRPWWWRRQARRYWAEYHPHCGQFHFVERWRQFPHGGNWAARRAALLAIGGFREQFGHHGGRIGAGEEVLAALQIQRLGGRIGIAPAARVVHCVAPQRMTLSVLWHTLRAGWGVRLHLETGLYIERVTSPLGQLKDVCLYTAAALHPRLNRFQRIERLLWAAVSLVLLKDFACIQISRLRRSPTACAPPRQQ